MAKAKNPVRGKLNKSLATHAGDETTVSQEYIDLPPGIQGGVATLVEAKLGVYQSGDNQGKQFMYLAGVVVEPIEHTYNPKILINGKVETQEAVTVRVLGQRTSLMIPWCDTTNRKEEITSADDHIADSLNRLRQLGADTSDVKTEEDLEAVFEALIKVKPVFKFGTRASNPTAQFPESRTWESWHGNEGLEDYESPDEDEVVDETEEDSEEEEPEEDKENEDDEDLQILGSEADKEEEIGDEDYSEARIRLTELAKSLDIDPDEEDANGNPVFETWSTVAIAIEGAQADGEKESTTPEVGEVWQYRPPKKRKLVEVLVQAVFPKKETANLKNLEDGSTLYKSVPWDNLHSTDDVPS
jgi:hypothetical protein